MVLLGLSRRPASSHNSTVQIRSSLIRVSHVSLKAFSYYTPSPNCTAQHFQTVLKRFHSCRTSTGTMKRGGHGSATCTLQNCRLFGSHGSPNSLGSFERTAPLCKPVQHLPSWDAVQVNDAVDDLILGPLGSRKHCFQGCLYGFAESPRGLGLSGSCDSRKQSPTSWIRVRVTYCLQTPWKGNDAMPSVPSFAHLAYFLNSALRTCLSNLPPTSTYLVQANHSVD